MGLRLIRQESETPNVSNHDDARMVRYAYGGYDGYVKNRGQEIGSTVSGTSFVVLSGVISLQGWEVEVDANGVSIPTSASVTNKTYFSVYLEVNCATDTAEIKSLTDTAGFPDVPASDDLTENTIGTARLLLYHFTATGGVIADVEKLVQEIPYGKETNTGQTVALSQLDMKKVDKSSVLQNYEGDKDTFAPWPIEKPGLYLFTATRDVTYDFLLNIRNLNDRAESAIRHLFSEGTMETLKAVYDPSRKVVHVVGSPGDIGLNAMILIIEYQSGV